jgi:hypothetical protein
LARVAAHHRARNDDHERLVKGLPTPVAIQIASTEVTDLQRAAVLRELRLRLAFSRDGLREYEAEVRGRLGR